MHHRSPQRPVWIVATLACVAAWLALSSDDTGPTPAASSARNERDAAPSDAVGQEVATAPQHTDRRERVADSRARPPDVVLVEVFAAGSPLPGATAHRASAAAACVRADSAMARSDPHGQMTIPVAAMAEADGLLIARTGYRSEWLPRPEPGERHRVELRPGLAMRFLCRLESGEPLPDARVTIARAAVPAIEDNAALLPGASADTLAASASSDRLGVATFSELLEGDYIVRAEHERAVVVRVDSRVHLTAAAAPDRIIEFARPVGVVLEVTGGRLLTWNVQGRECRIAGTIPFHLQAVAERVRGRYADRHRFVVHVAVAATSTPSASIELWTERGERFALQRDLAPLYPEFIPERVDLSKLAGEPVPTGTLHLRFVGPNSEPIELADAFHLRSAYMQMLAFPIRADRTVSLPSGRYRLQTGDIELRRCVDDPTVEILPGRRTERAVRLSELPVRLTWTVELEDRNTFRSGVLEVLDADGRAIRGGMALPADAMWLRRGAEYRFSFRVGPFRLSERVTTDESGDGSRRFVLSRR